LRLELLDPIDWETIVEGIDSEFGEGITKALKEDRQPVALIDRKIRRLYLIPSEWMGFLIEEEANTSGVFDLRFLGKELGSIVKGRLRLSLQVLPELVQLTSNILQVTSQAGEAFTYGRSILKEGVVNLEQSLKRGERLLVVNSDGECLGIASLSVDAHKLHRLASEKLVAKNLADVGWYIRRLG
jgi:ribosome biogenesis protein Nip4